MRERRFNQWIVLLAAWCTVSCGESATTSGAADSYVEPQPQCVQFTNISVEYSGDDVGEKSSDGWILKLWTDMEIDAARNPIGPGAVAQLLLNVTYNGEQKPDVALLPGRYTSQSNSGDYSPRTFVSGYTDYIDTPAGLLERADGTFYAAILEGSTEMDADLIDDGVVQIERLADGTFAIEGVLVGPKCIKHHFAWSGTFEPSSSVVPTVQNSTLTSSIELDNLVQAQLQDKGDYFYLKDESYRDFVVFLGAEGLDFTMARPQGSGALLRLELLVPWSCNKADGVPAGEYRMVVRNADTSIDRAQIVPYAAIPGLPDVFVYYKWAGSWYVDMADGEWGENYARIADGRVVVSRGEDGSHTFECRLLDCEEPAHEVTAVVHIEADRFTIL